MSRYGLVLSSDGSKSSFEIGTWKAMNDMNMEITSVAGSFVGALNAALIAQNDFEKAVRFWRNVSNKELLGVNRHIAQKYTEEWSRTSTRSFRRNFMAFINGKSEELDPLREVINNYIDERAVRRSKINCSFVTISLKTLEAEMINIKKIPPGKLNQYILSAACFPQITQTNRAADAQFSSKYSPYLLVDRDRIDGIISTDEIIVVPSQIRNEVKIIRSSEAMELNINETADEMRHHIKLGYIDTLKMYQKSYGNVYFIPDMWPDDEFNKFKDKIGRPLNLQLDELVKLILKLEFLTPRNAQIRFAQMLKNAGIRSGNLYISLIENAAQIIGIPLSDRYTPDKLVNEIKTKARDMIVENRPKFRDVQYIRDLVIRVADPGNSFPSGDLFIQYFILFLSSKPQAYKKLVPLLQSLNVKTLVAFVTLIYLLY